MWCRISLSKRIRKVRIRNDLLEDFKARLNTAKTNHIYSSDVNSDFGEKSKRDQLIVMDDVPGLADESKKLGSFLKVARKLNYTCVYIFHTIYPGKSIWKTILSRTNIFNIFPASVSLTSVWKILGVCIRKTRDYIPQSVLWISRLFIELANRDVRVCLTLLFIELPNRKDRVCLTLDCSGINKDGPGKFIKEADKPDFQTYFNLTNDEQAYNKFVSKRINEREANYRIRFKIVHLKSKINGEENFHAK